jgi:heat shock protein HtpX
MEHRYQVGFPPDRGLQVRMVAVIVVNVLLLLLLAALIVASAFAGGWTIGVWLAIIALIGFKARGRVTHQPLPGGPEVVRCQRALEPLCIVAAAPAPELAVLDDPVPLSWTFAPRRRRPTIYVTTGLIQAVSDDELSAVLAHELSHIINRDAALMTLLAGIPTSLVRGAKRLRGRHWWRAYFTGAYYVLPALLPLATSRIFSRYRELAADRGSALLTGSPAGVEAALLKLSKSLQGIPHTDLREAAVSDLFHFLPANPQPVAGVHRIWATHPPLARRLAELERMELELQRPTGVDRG